MVMRKKAERTSKKNVSTAGKISPPPGLRRVLERPIIQPDAQEGIKVMKKIVAFFYGNRNVRWYAGRRKEALPGLL